MLSRDGYSSLWVMKIPDLPEYCLWTAGVHLSGKYVGSAREEATSTRLGGPCA